MEGTIKVFDQNKGQGIINYYTFHDIYFCYTDFKNEDYIKLKEGMRVQFDVVDDRIQNAKLIETDRRNDDFL